MIASEENSDSESINSSESDPSFLNEDSFTQIPFESFNKFRTSSRRGSFINETLNFSDESTLSLRDDTIVIDDDTEVHIGAAANDDIIVLDAD